jgi:RHS repeat-associated protein
LGSITALTNAAGEKVQTYSYDSFGNMTSGTPTVTQPFTFTAREFDTETGMYFYRARYYDSKVGRFVTKDPIGFKGGINVYAYVGNNAVNRIDPMGLDDGWSWYGGWPWNGSPIPGYWEQDNECSIPGSFGGNYLNNNPCTKQCCIDHDNCYKKYGCNMSSWAGSPYLLPGPCQVCNITLSICVPINMGKNDCGCK